jgi:hypothetical protein
MNVVVVPSVSVEVRAYQEGTDWHALVELLSVLRAFVSVSSSAVSGLAFVDEVVLSLVWV